MWGGRRLPLLPPFTDIHEDDVNADQWNCRISRILLTISYVILIMASLCSGNSFNQRYQCNWMAGIAEEGPVYRRGSTQKVTEVFENEPKFKMDSTITSEGCAKVCSKTKEKNSNITGVMVRRKKEMFNCWCLASTTNVHINYDRNYQSCVLVLKGEMIWFSYYRIG